jgi:hypothetical protein
MNKFIRIQRSLIDLNLRDCLECFFFYSYLTALMEVYSEYSQHLSRSRDYAKKKRTNRNEDEEERKYL